MAQVELRYGQSPFFSAVPARPTAYACERFPEVASSLHSKPKQTTMSAESGQPPPRDLSLKSARVVSLGNGHQLLVLNPPGHDPQQWAPDASPMFITPVRGQLFGVGEGSCEQPGVYAAHPSGDGLKRVLTVDESTEELRHLPHAAGWKVEEAGNPSFPTWWSEPLSRDVSRRLSQGECHRRASAG